jgi:hypothetical protein
MKKSIGIVSLVVLATIASTFALINVPPKNTAPQRVATPTISTTQSAPDTAMFSYKGVAGKDALTLLKARFHVEQNASGLVTSIHGQKADDKKHEYWGFFVNGKMAEVGPAQYVTKDGDVLLWKIERY